MRKTLLLASMLFSAAAHAEPVETSETTQVQSAVVTMTCLTEDMVTGNIGTANGTMWRLGQGQMITAFHVWNIGKCGGDHQSFHPVFTDYDLDIAILATDDANVTSLQIDCTPIKKGDTFVGYGYVHQILQRVEVTATGNKVQQKDTPRWPGGYIVKGANRSVGFEHGMSGGPLINQNGKVQGIIVGHDDSAEIVNSGESYVRALADTPLCGKTTNQVLAENGVKLLVLTAKK
jgi:hypothetical protein